MTMAETSTQPFLDGQGIPVELPSIEDELAKLWGPAAEQAGGPEPLESRVTRIVLANLVVECLGGGGEALAPVLETVIARFPSRAIVMCGTGDPSRRIKAEVSALCHLPAAGMPQVCSERIVLGAGANALDLLPGAVRPLLEADLPWILWWTSDPRPCAPLFRDLADECSRLILDLPDALADPGALELGLDPALCAWSRDSAWFGLTRWRELIAQFFDPHCHAQSLRWLSEVRIEALSPRPERVPRLAVWLASWLAGQLGWKAVGAPVQRASAAESVLNAEFAGPAGPITLGLRTRALPPGQSGLARLSSVNLVARAPDGLNTFRVSRPDPDSSEVVIDVGGPNLCRLPRRVEAPDLDPARRIAAALESSRNDPPFQNARPIAIWLLASTAAEP
jgi:glucose-6-phosphate dehydrogenase assembly protein OpcA